MNQVSPFQSICRKYGISLKDFRADGLNYNTAYQHWRGHRLVSMKSALLYSQFFGIPIEEFYSLAAGVKNTAPQPSEEQ